MTAPAPGTKEIEEVQPNRDLLVYFCVSRAPSAARFRQSTFGRAPSAAHPSAVHFRQRALVLASRQRNVWLPPLVANHDEASNGSPSALS